jgi:hypothetical protein
MAELSIYRVVVQARKNPAGTYTYVITRTDDPTWEESSGELYSPKRPRKLDGLLWIAFGQRRRRVSHDLPQTHRRPSKLALGFGNGGRVHRKPRTASIIVIALAPPKIAAKNVSS